MERINDCKTYPDLPYTESENIMYKNFQNLIENLEKYINYSYCDCIDPTYEIPLMPVSKSYSLIDFYPIQFLDSNISSDEGFYDTINFLLTKRNSKNYQVILVDVGIFWRYYKWIYNPEIRIPSSQSTCYFLGFWHTYKELCQLIYQRCITYFFGPIFGKLLPNSPLLLKPKLGILETYFNWLMMFYPSIKEKLKHLIIKSKGLKKKFLKNIRFILRSAIPFVSY